MNSAIILEVEMIGVRKKQLMWLLCTLVFCQSASSFVTTDACYRHQQRRHTVHWSTTSDAILGPRVPINENFPGLKKNLRTSTSTTLDDMSDFGAREFVRQAARLFHPSESCEQVMDSSSPFMQEEAALFEAPTVIRYEPDQILAPHYDANRSADTEDANRGGQTLATLLLYLNDVEKGGLTRFGKLSAGAAMQHDAKNILLDANDEGDQKLVVQPKRGDALLFFPADCRGLFDPRTEHEGMPAIDEKWIARIWKHQRRVPSPFGLSESSLANMN